MTDSRITSEDESISRIIDYRQSRIKTAIPAHVLSYDKSKQTVEVEIPFSETYETVEGQSTEQWGIVPDVPVQWPRGGGGSFTFPIEKGDLVLLVISSRSLEDWWQTDGKQITEPRSVRMHNVSDAIAIPGISTEQTALPADAVSADGWVINYEGTRIEGKKDGKINTRCTRLNIGADGASTALAKATTTDSNISALETKVNAIIASSIANGGLIIGVTPIVPGGSTASGKAFTND